MKYLAKSLVYASIAIAPFNSGAQDSSTISEISGLPSKYYEQISKRMNSLENKFNKKTEQYLQKISSQEKKLYAELKEKDPAKAKDLFGNISDRYNGLQERTTAKIKKLTNFSKVYSGKLDSLGTSLSFLKSNESLKLELKSKVEQGLQSINALQGKLDQTDQVKKFLANRKEFLENELSKVGMLKNMKKFNKNIYYYQQQLQEYKNLLNDPSGTEEKLISLLREIPAFRNFFNQNSTLGGLFRLPGSSDGTSTSLIGLQTRAAVLQDLQTRFGTDASALQKMQQNLKQGQDQLNELRLKTSPTEGQSGKPLGFKANNQKTKSFWKRFEFGINFQSGRNNRFLPVTTDIGLSIGYKLNDKSIVGLGGSYLLGWGQNIRNIHINSQGAGIRSFLDWKIKRSFYITGGYEMNYRTEFNRVEQLKELNQWQRSGLIGVSKLISLKSKLLKKTKIQLLWDFLSYKQIPQTRPVIFRVGYNLN